MIVLKQDIEPRRFERHKKHDLSRRKLGTVEGNNFVVVNLPQDLIAVFSAEVFELIGRIEVEQVFVDVAEVGRNSAR